jgi:hypothetical protein
MFPKIDEGKFWLGGGAFVGARYITIHLIKVTLRSNQWTIVSQVSFRDRSRRFPLVLTNKKYGGRGGGGGQQGFLQPEGGLGSAG